jgi:TctA family transporter
VIGGLFGTAVLIVAAPALARIALKFSSFEYFWLVVLGFRAPFSSRSAIR